MQTIFSFRTIRDILVILLGTAIYGFGIVFFNLARLIFN
jgi:uncharacterized membrane-anchored protein YitT (DUF2179 family)